jgi:UDP-N-acetylglucosamine--N-acetylmuramyl-(pentapeptide) pyrophosphoryl-undecaprenol N-acetylglucosamine transferase
VFGKGGYATFPAVFAARILGIPVVLHESDSEPGLVNKWAGKFAQKIALSYPTAAEFFPAGKTAYTGNPVRKEIQDPLTTESHKLLGLEPDVPTIFVLGGSQGSRAINNILMDALPDLVLKYQIIHQTGKNNFKVIGETAEVVLLKNPNKDRYKAFDYLNVLQMRASSGVADLIISRAGSTIFEIALWGKPSIIIPIPETISHDQRSNAYAYARSGACEVIEEKNLTHHVLVAEVTRIISNPEEKEKMHKAAAEFARRDSAQLIAKEILQIAMSHDQK